MNLVFENSEAICSNNCRNAKLFREFRQHSGAKTSEEATLMSQRQRGKELATIKPMAQDQCTLNQALLQHAAR